MIAFAEKTNTIDRLMRVEQNVVQALRVADKNFALMRDIGENLGIEIPNNIGNTLRNVTNDISDKSNQISRFLIKNFVGGASSWTKREKFTKSLERYVDK